MSEDYRRFVVQLVATHSRSQLIRIAATYEALLLMAEQEKDSQVTRARVRILATMLALYQSAARVDSIPNPVTQS